jgi:hypothetical protein
LENSLTATEAGQGEGRNGAEGENKDRGEDGGEDREVDLI